MVVQWRNKHERCLSENELCSLLSTILLIGVLFPCADEVKGEQIRGETEVERRRRRRRDGSRNSAVQ